MKIDDKTVVPIGWVLGGFATLLAIAVTTSIQATLWVSSVDDRLSRIEDHLKIQKPTAHISSFLPLAHAGDKK